VEYDTAVKVPIALVCLSYSHLARAQGTFDNLDFEQANPAVVGPYTVTAASAIPDWIAEIGAAQQTDIKENFFSTGAPEVVLLSANTQQPPLYGDYSILLTASSVSASISQTGMIPAGTQSLFFDAQSVPQYGNLAVMIGTQIVPFVPVATEPNYTVYGANISAWAGQTEQLTFSALPVTIALNDWEIDDISFSPTAMVPEPSPLALAGIGTVLFAIYRRVAQRR
jgi:hypothetical protein